MVYTGAAELANVDEEVIAIAAEDRARIGADNELSFRDGSLARAAEQRIKLQSPVRKAVSPWWSAALLRFFGDAPEELVVGADGYLFLRNRVELKQATIDDGPDATANLLYALRRRSATRGMRLISIPIPRKSAVLKDKLPTSTDPAADVELRLHAALESRGDEFVNSLDAWEGMDPVNLYDMMDSHWSIPAQVATAKALVRTFPELKRGDHESGYFSKPDKPSMELLRFAGVESFHPSRGMFPVEDHGKVLIKDKAVAKRLKNKDFVGDIVLTGTSFSKSTSFHPILTVLTQSDLELGADNGSAMLETFSQLVADRKVTGVYPSVVLDEFPVSHLEQVMIGTPRTMRAFGNLFTDLDVQEVIPLPDAHAAALAGSLAGKKVYVFPERSVVSSGDGAVSIEFIAESDHASSWTLMSSGCRFSVRLDGLGSRALIPVIEVAKWTGQVMLYPVKGNDPNAKVALRAVVEGSPVTEDGANLRLTADGDGYGLKGSHAVDAGDTFFFQWAEPCEELSIELKGLDSKGAPVSDTYAFSRPGGTSAAIAPRRIGGGTLTGVRITGPDGSVALMRVRVARP